jgi:murein DD-endopeptidase MepM/ murein hydrolase activator NlpD
MFMSFFRTGFGAAAALVALVTTPAFANSSATADIATPLRTATMEKPTALGSRDEQFKALFSRWQSMDTGSTAPQSTVSIPSRTPLDNVRLSSGYGERWHPVSGGRRQHHGVDLASPTGTPIYAAADGLVGKADWFGAYGLYVQLEHGGELQTRYGHMSRLNVAPGQRVRKGDVIGYVGSTGRSTGPHLHYEVRIAGKAVNPVPYMQPDTRLYAAADSTAAQGGPEN